MVVAFAIIFTWIFNHTRESVFISNILHTSIDTPQLVWIPLFLGLGEYSVDLASLIGFGVPALLIVILTRGRLGYQQGQMTTEKPKEAKVRRHRRRVIDRLLRISN